MFFRKQKKYEIDINTANTALQNVFVACKQTPNTIPFDKLLLRQKANTRLYNLLLCIVTAVLLFTFFSPLIITPISNIVGGDVAKTTFVKTHYLRNDILYIQLEGEDIHFNAAYMSSADGMLYEPASYDEASQTICFEYINKECNIYIPYGEDKQLHLLFTPSETN